MSHELTIKYVVTVTVDDCEDYTKTQKEIDNIANELCQLYAPSQAGGAINVDIDEWYWSDDDPKPEELNPYPSSDFIFIIDGQPWVANAISAIHVGALNGQEPPEPWIKWGEKQPTKIIELIKAYSSKMPQHPGRFSEFMTLFIGDRLVLGTAKDSPGYLVDSGNLVGVIMPVLDQKPKK